MEDTKSDPCQLQDMQKSQDQLDFEMKLSSNLGDKQTIKRLISDDITLSWREKWLSISSIARSNPSCSKSRELLRIYVHMLKLASENEFLRLKAKFTDTLDLQEKEIWDFEMEMKEIPSEDQRAADPTRIEESKSDFEDAKSVEEISALDDRRALIRHNPSDIRNVEDQRVTDVTVKYIQASIWEREEAVIISLMPSSYLIYSSMPFLGDGETYTFAGSCIVFLVLWLLRFIARYLFIRLRGLRQTRVRNSQHGMV